LEEFLKKHQLLLAKYYADQRRYREAAQVFTELATKPNRSLEQRQSDLTNAIHNMRLCSHEVGSTDVLDRLLELQEVFFFQQFFPTI
jgi:hypothetical protein